MQADLNAMAHERRGLRSYGCSGLGHIRAEFTSTGGGASGAPGRDRSTRSEVSLPWRGNSRRGGEPRGCGSTGRLRSGRPVQQGLYSTETKEEEETVDPEEEELEEEEEEILSDAEPLQYSQSKAGKAL